MYDVDAAVLAAIRSSHVTVLARVSALTADGSIVGTWGAGDERLEDGSVTFDRTRAARRSAVLTLANPTGDLAPREAGDPFFTGERIRCERGIVLPSGIAWIPLFEGVVTDFRATSTGHLAVSAQDPFWLCQQPLGDLVTLSTGTRAEDAVRTFLEPVLGDDSPWSLDGYGRTLTAPRSFLEDDDRLASIVGLVSDLGLELYADRRGRPVLRPRTDPTTAATVRTFRDDEDAWMLELSRSGARLPYNRVIVVSASPSGAVLRAEAEVTDPASPIHRDRIGLRTAPIHRSAQIPDQATANAVARALLVEYALVVDAVGGSAVPDPTLDEDDVVAFEDEPSGTAGRYRIDQVTHPLAMGPMSLATTRVAPIFLTA
jgi:hypothetical protein